MALKNQEIDLEVNPYVNSGGTNQEVSVIRRATTYGCIETSIGLYCEPLGSKNRAEARDQALRRCYRIDNNCAFCCWFVSKEKAEQHVIEMRFNPLLSTLWGDMEDTAVQNTAPEVWIRRLPGMRIVSLHLGNTQLSTLQVLEHEYPRSS